MAKMFFLGTLLVLLAFPARAEELLMTLPAEAGAFQAGEVIAGNTLRLAAEPDRPFRLLLELPDPGVTAPVYALKGMVRYENVEGDAYLQMDSHFAGKGTFFSKTLGPSGPLGKLTGSSDWRAFTLPFYANVGDQVQAGETLTPGKLTLGLYLPAGGTVFLRDIRLYQYATGEDPMRASGQWLGSRALILLGAIGGSAIGVWGAVAGSLASRGKARGFVIGSATVLIVFGIACLGGGIAALATGQPYGVYFPLLLFGGIVVMVVGGLRRMLPRRYEALELKKMQALDV